MRSTNEPEMIAEAMMAKVIWKAAKHRPGGLGVFCRRCGTPSVCAAPSGAKHVFFRDIQTQNWIGLH